VQLGFELPLVFYQRRDADVAGANAPLASLSSFGFGDLRLVPKFGLFRSDDDGFSVALIPALTVPLGGSKAYLRENGVTFVPELAVSGMAGIVRLAANVGYRVRRNAALLDLRVEDELVARAGIGVRPGGPDGALELDLTASGATAAADPFGAANRNAGEVNAGVLFDTPSPVTLFAGAGWGIARGFGTPDFRLFGGLWLRSPREDDPDRDGIRGAADRCPMDPEDKDGFEDTDGCPDPDNDRDGIPDRRDRCPNDPETMNDYLDDDGCPDQVPDSDGDGLRDNEDKCPSDPEDRDDFEDEDGCPDPDNDLDGVLDVNDECPNEPGHADNKGCPDRDRDGDGLVDREDACPDEPGPRENRGCKVKQLAVITKDRIEILEAVYFDTNKATIQARSFPVLDSVASLLERHGEITKVRVEGHTDSRGSDDANLKLSQRRAAAVVKYLTDKGVDGGRLTPRGFGESQPIETNNTAEGRAKNRRVVFTIEERAP
jgi:outer membrane protein OmpA-like peptidoglycan-associated protein